MRKSLIFVTFVVLISILALSVRALPVSLEAVKVDGSDLDPWGYTKLDLERGQSFDLSVRVMSYENLSDVEVTTFISGYEYSDRQPLSASSGTFDMEAYTSYVKKMKLTLPSNVAGDNYKLRILVTNRNGYTSNFDYDLKISQPRHDVEIKDVVLNPSTEVQAGHALLGSVRVRNYGQKDESSLKAKISIPGLGVSAVHYLDELDSEEATTSEELFLRIPNCAIPGTYTVKTTVEYDEGYALASKDSTIVVTAGDLCTQGTQSSGQSGQAGGQSIVTFGAEMQEISVGQGGAIYPITIQNTGTNSKTYVISLDGADFADYKISPSNMITLLAGQSKTAYVYMAAKPTTSSGLQTFIVSVTADSDVKQAALKANVKGGSTTAKPMSGASVQNAVLAVFIVLVVVLVILGLVLAFSKKNDSETEKGKYY
jgi:uncharacterized membrane protein